MLWDDGSGAGTGVRTGASRRRLDLRSADRLAYNLPILNFAICRHLELLSADVRPAPLMQRLAAERVLEALEESPVVLIHGPRQSGKTTLAKEIGGQRGYAYFSLDDDALLAAAQVDPVGFVADLPARAIIDEIQRAPTLFTSLKAVIDADRAAGRFILTGSSNVLLLPTLADSLAGRMEVIKLLPLSQVELLGSKPWFLSATESGAFPRRPARRLGQRLAELILAGGYPAALARTTPARRARWYLDYVDALVQRDVRDLANIANLDVLPRLMEAAASQTARLLNVSELAAPFQVSRQTIRDYVTLLERVFLIDEQQPLHLNRLARLVKSAKLHIGDTGMGGALLRVDATALYEERALFGRLLETFVYQELRRQAVAQEVEPRLLHYRDRDQYEVDIVLQFGANRLGGVEVKASSTVTEGDFRGLRKLAGAAGTAFTAGVVLYDGEHTLSFGDKLYAVPIDAIWH